MPPNLRRYRTVLLALFVMGCVTTARAQDVAKKPASPPAPEPGKAERQGAPAQGEEPGEYGAVATASRTAPLRTPLPATVLTIDSAQLQNTPTLTRDALLRSEPSVATFRRSTSFNADPSSQGLNLRGVAPSGVSRALVLVDGVPVNDPFAGSVYWRALPRLGLSRVEIVPGGGSALYGSSALSGVVQFLSRDSYPRSYAADLSYGMANTLSVAGYGAGGTRKASGAVEGEWLSSDGFHVVAKDQRGAIDAPAQSYSGSLLTRGELRPGKRWRLSSALSLFREELWGATRYTNAAAQLSALSLRARYDAGARGSWDVLVFGRLASFDQERARILEQRSREALSVRQHVPASDQGGALVWLGPRPRGETGHALSLGVDARHVWGSSRERLFPAEPMAGSLLRRITGGQQLLVGAFAEDVYRAHARVQLHGALRYDVFRNFAGERTLKRASSDDESRSFAGLTYHAVSPRLGVLVTPLDWLELRGSAYRSFRAPTLNELYRPFQVGTVLTAANERLKPEYLTGGELGVRATPHPLLSLRSTGFWNRLEAPIINASLAQALADGSMRQRRNLGRARIAGVEAAVELRMSQRVQLQVAYTWVDARVTKQGSLEGLRGKRLAQDPAHRGSAIFLFDDPRWLTASVQLRVLGKQYEDDLNTLSMKRYAVVDLLLARRLFWALELFAAMENLFNQSYLVGRAGVDTIGTPFLARAGLRIRDPGRSGP